MIHRINSAIVVMLFTVHCVPVWSQNAKPPEPGYVFPPAVEIGRTTDVMLGGFDFTSDMQWLLHDPCITLHTDGIPGDYHLPPPPFWSGPRASSPAPPIPREVRAAIQVSADAQPGLVRWQVANACGASGAAMLMLSSEPEIVEQRSRDFAQVLPELPVNVSGRLSRLTEVDRYQFTARSNAIVCADLMARRLGSAFHGVIEVFNAEVRLIADFADTAGFDGRLLFPATAGETYTVCIRDVDFRGDRAFIYRLSLTDQPVVLGMLPAAGQAGTTRPVEFQVVRYHDGRATVESIRRDVTFEMLGHSGAPEFRPQASLQVSETASAGDAKAGLSFSGFQPVTVDIGDSATTVKIPLSAFPELIRNDRPNENGRVEQFLEAPCGVSGRMSADDNECRFQWQVHKGEEWLLTAHSRALGSQLDTMLTVLDPDGQTVAENDDRPGLTDSEVRFAASHDGVYTVVLRGFADSVPSGPTMFDSHFFRLTFEKPEPDFRLTVPQTVSLPLNGKIELPIQVHRQGGFANDIRLEVTGLPEGVQVSGDLLIPGTAKEFKLPVECSADASVTAGFIRIRGTGRLADDDQTGYGSEPDGNAATPGGPGRDLVRTACAISAGNLCPKHEREQYTGDILLTVTMAAPFSIQVVDRERQRDVSRGTTFLAELDILRHDGFEGPIRLEMTARQDRTRMGVRGGIITVPPGQTKAFYPVFMPEWLSTDLTRRIVVHGVAEIPDPQGRMRQVSRAADARITMIMEGALLKLGHEAYELTVDPGQSFQIPVNVSRSPKLSLPVVVELIVPEEVQGHLSAESLELAPEVSLGVLIVNSTPSSMPAGPWKFTLRATALQDGLWPVVSEAEVPVEFSGVISPQ